LQCGYTTADIAGMRMRSRAYVALRLQNHVGQGPLGVVLAESQFDATQFDPHRAMNLLRREADHLAGTLFALR
jgi:hypothetical protein